MRISLGLKPLSTENNADRERKEHEAQRRKQEAAQKERDTAELADRVKRCVLPAQLSETRRRLLVTDKPAAVLPAVHDVRG